MHNQLLIPGVNENCEDSNIGLRKQSSLVCENLLSQWKRSVSSYNEAILRSRGFITLGLLLCFLVCDQTSANSHMGHANNASAPELTQMALQNSEQISYNAQPLLLASAAAEEIELLLRERYVSQAGDPSSLPRDLHTLARYYAKYPEARTLLLALKDHPWELKYTANTYKTDIFGTSLSVDKVTIYFDPKSGAKLKFYPRCEEKIRFCVASPADALLHEFLHTYIIFEDTNRFIAKGGMSTHIYPIDHERDTIQKENALYEAMSERDMKPRPIRKDHVGRATLVGCVTCAQ